MNNVAFQDELREHKTRDTISPELLSFGAVQALDCRVEIKPCKATQIIPIEICVNVRDANKSMCTTVADLESCCNMRTSICLQKTRLRYSYERGSQSFHRRPPQFLGLDRCHMYCSGRMARERTTRGLAFISSPAAP